MMKSVSTDVVRACEGLLIMLELGWSGKNFSAHGGYMKADDDVDIEQFLYTLLSIHDLENTQKCSGNLVHKNCTKF